MSKKKVIIIGSGFAGLSAASFMAKAGWEVHVFEKHEGPGGRARQFRTGAFTFDMGPSWYWMPDVFERYFQQFGKQVSDYYHLERLDPSYRIFWEDGNTDIPADFNALKQLFESIEPGAGAQLERFIKEARYKYETGINNLVYKPGQSLLEFLDWSVISGVLRLDVFTSMKKHVNSFFKHPRLRQIMEFPVLFLGALPEDTPALYSLMNYADIIGGTWYPKGGMYSIVEGMHRLAVECGVQFHFNQEVKKIIVENKTATGILSQHIPGNSNFLSTNAVNRQPSTINHPSAIGHPPSAMKPTVNRQPSTVNYPSAIGHPPSAIEPAVNRQPSTVNHPSAIGHPPSAIETAVNCQPSTVNFSSADVIIGAADYHFIETELLEAPHRTYSKAYWDARVMAPSCLLYYVGLNRRIKGITHHSLFFDVPFDRHAEEIYKQPQWPGSPLFYVSATSVTDDTVAPPGGENLFLLMPVAAGLNEDTAELRERYFDIMISRMEKHFDQPIRDAIVFKRSFAHSDFINEYNSFRGNAYGLANTLMQTAILKPSLRSKKIRNLFYTGQLTVPGPGVPPSLISGEVVAKEIVKHYSYQ